jgi:hypothetical protein
MTFKKAFLILSVGMGSALVVACASQPQANPAPPAAPANATASAPAVSEANTAGALEKRFQDVARGYKVVKKDGKTMYCKREKLIGSTIPTMNCMSETQLRTQVEDMDEYRNRARNSSRCTHGVGCAGGS